MSHNPSGKPSRLVWQEADIPLPAGWEPVVLQKQYLRLENRDGPALEVKWRRLDRAFNPDKYVRRMRRRFPRKVRFELDEKALPGQWSQAAEKLRQEGKLVHPFAWSLGAETGLGAAVLCPQCGRASLINFLAGAGELRPGQAARFLANFSDHQDGPEVDWAVFDIGARVPRLFSLASQSFHPGHFQLCFKMKGIELTLDRLGPASVILKNRALGEWGGVFFGERGGSEQTKPRAVGDKNTPALEWDWQRHTWAGGRILARMRSKPLAMRLRIWQPEGTNKLLCVYSQGRKVMDPKAFERICGEFKIVRV